MASLLLSPHPPSPRLSLSSSSSYSSTGYFAGTSQLQSLKWVSNYPNRKRVYPKFAVDQVPLIDQLPSQRIASLKLKLLVIFFAEFYVLDG